MNMNIPHYASTNKNSNIGTMFACWYVPPRSLADPSRTHSVPILKLQWRHYYSPVLPCRHFVCNHGVSSSHSARFSHRTVGIWCFNDRFWSCFCVCCRLLEFVRWFWNLGRHLGKQCCISMPDFDLSCVPYKFCRIWRLYLLLYILLYSRDNKHWDYHHLATAQLNACALKDWLYIYKYILTCCAKSSSFVI